MTKGGEDFNDNYRINNWVQGCKRRLGKGLTDEETRKRISIKQVTRSALFLFEVILKTQH